MDPPDDSTLSRDQPNPFPEHHGPIVGVAITHLRIWPFNPARRTVLSAVPIAGDLVAAAIRRRPADGTLSSLRKQVRGQARWQGLGTAPAPPATASQPACW